VSGVDQILKGLQDTVAGNVHKRIESNSHHVRKNESTLPLWLLPASRRFLARLMYSLTLKMETFSTETWAYFRRAARRYIPFMTNAVRTFRYCADSINTDC
jgi:hypothetical protein